MHVTLGSADATAAAIDVAVWASNLWQFVKVLIGFSIIIFVHELGHFLAAKWVGVRVERFAVGFTYRLFGWRRGEGFTFGPRPHYTADEIRERRWGETDYCFNALPFGGYVKMMGQDDILIDEKTGEISFSRDPRAFTSRPVGQRMIVVSAGVVFNVLFAALLFMAVYLIGRELESPVLGAIPADSPAAAAGLAAGDRILKINGDEVRTFVDVVIPQVLTDGPLRFEVERNGKRIDDIVVTAERRGDQKFRSIGVQGARTTRMLVDGDPVPGKEPLKAGDRITHVNGQAVNSDTAVLSAYLNSRGAIAELRVERSDPKQPNAPPREVVAYERPALVILPAERRPRGQDRAFDKAHVLGLRPRRVVREVFPGSPAAKAGFRSGDAIAAWGAVANPTYAEIKESIEAQAGQPIRVLVDRGDERVELSVTPSRAFRLFGEAPAQVGIDFGPMGETARPIIAAVEPGTPAAALNIPRGSHILSIDDRPIADWYELVNTLMDAAAGSVAVRFRSGADEAVGSLAVPSSIVNELNLPPRAAIYEIGGESSVTAADGTTLRLPNHYAIRELLQRKVGQTVRVKFARDDTDVSSIGVADFTVRPDNIDAWQMRILTACDTLRFEPLKERVSAGGNPLKALWLGVDETFSKLVEVYAVIRQMLKQNVGVENVSGPVGIFDHAIQQAKLGIVDLLHFLAFLSINLAVLNFLPFPLVDGGLMVFLIIEKIKGKPLSIKTQMISTLVGLALIVLCFLFVTFQDVSKLL